LISFTHYSYDPRIAKRGTGVSPVREGSCLRGDALMRGKTKSHRAGILVVQAFQPAFAKLQA